MSFRLLNRNACGSTILPALRRSHSLRPHRFNATSRSQFHFSAGNQAPTTATVKVLPSLGKAAAQEILKGIESRDENIKFTAEEKQQIENMVLTAFTSKRSSIINDLNNLRQTYFSISQNFNSIEASLMILDISFTEKWRNIKKLYETLCTSSKSTASKYATIDFKDFIHDVLSQPSGFYESYDTRLRNFEQDGTVQENLFRLLRADVDNFRSDFVKTVAESRRISRIDIEAIDAKIEKLQKDLDKSQGLLGSWSSSTESKELSSQMHALKITKTSLQTRVKALEKLENDALLPSSHLNQLSGQLAQLHGIWRMINSDAVATREKLGSVERARGTHTPEFLATSKHTLFVSYELFCGALESYDSAIPKNEEKK